MNMRHMAGLVAASLLGTSAIGQSTLDWPSSEWQFYPMDSGIVALSGFRDVIHVANTDWLRVHFDVQTSVPDGAVIRLTSLLDGEVQELDATELAVWGHGSAYFNGDSVVVELIGPRHGLGGRVVISEVERRAQWLPIGSPGSCGICGDDERVPSNEQWAGRLLPAGCTASVWNTESCLVSAGHCISSSNVMQFNVPSSNGNCSINQPPVEDQFPVLDWMLDNGGIGYDWAVMTSGPNEIGQSIYDRYGELRPIAANPSNKGDALEVFGYGVDHTCERSQTQQHAGGPMNEVHGLFYEYEIDIRGGNSGSALLHNNQIIGIVTHCGCGVGFPSNYATRVDSAEFEAAREAMCDTDTGTPNCPSTGSCFVPHETGGCDDVTCCMAVCACDPFCCESQWDIFCAGEGFDGDGCGAMSLCKGPVGPVNDDCIDAISIVDGDFAFDTTQATTDGPPLPSACDVGTGSDLVQDIWYRYTAQCSGSVVVSTCNQASFATRLAAYTGTCGDLTLIACKDFEGECAFEASILDFDVECGQEYLIRVGGQTGGGEATLTVDCVGNCGGVTGACCSDDGFCTMQSPAECKIIGGTYMGDGSPCGPGVCPDTVGACCLGAGGCLDLTPEACSDAGGLFVGLGTECSFKSCKIDCEEDLNDDGSVDTNDLLILLGVWGPCGACAADFSGNGTVDVTDLLFLLGAWGPC